MPNVSVTINGRLFDIACGPGEEERVKHLATLLRERMEKLSSSLGPVSESMLFAVTALLLTDELEQKTKEVQDIMDKKSNHDTERESLLSRAIEDMAIRIEAIATKLEAA
jgi:cell division protein ZapA